MDAPAVRTQQFTKRKACLQCTKSKRKCDRSSPRCLRCLDKGVECQYPPSRRVRHFRASSTEGDSGVFPSPPSPRPFPSRHHQHARGHANSDPNDLLVNDRWFLTPDSFVKLLHNRHSHDESISSQYQDRIIGDETVEFLETVRAWMKQWATEGHSPVVHRHLYSGGYMPECVEDAFTVLATYHSSTANPQIKKTALQIADRRARRLIASFRVPQFQHDVHQQQSPSDSEMCEAIVIDTQTHLARTLALFTYQVMGLLDTDIRARSNAEDYIETLSLWASQMLESARLDSLTADIEAGTSPLESPDNPSSGFNGGSGSHHLGPTPQGDQELSAATPFDSIMENACVGGTASFMNMINMDGFLSFSDIPPITAMNTTSSSSSSSNSISISPKNPFILAPKSSSSSSRTAQHHHISSLHRAWLIAESVRRVYITAIYTQSVYITLKRGAGTTCPFAEESVCPGGMTFTARAGLWDAPSGYRWFNLVKQAVGVTAVGEDAQRDGGDADDNNINNNTGTGPTPGKGSRDGAGGMLMLKTNEAWKVLEGVIPARPKDVDEFTRAILMICFGKEWIMERWLDLDHAGGGG